MSPTQPGSDDLAADLARKTSEFEVLQRVSSAINSTLELEEIYDIALRAMDDFFEFHHANILLMDDSANSLEVVASRGYEGQAIGGRVALGTGVIGIAARERRMLHVNNLGQHRAYVAAQRREMVKAGRGAEIGDAVPVPGLPNAQSQVAMPLLIRDDLIGVFSIESPVRRTFTDHERELITIVANQIASAIHNARLYEQRRRAAVELQEANTSLETRVQERTAALERELHVARELFRDARTRVEGALLGESVPAGELRRAIAVQATRCDALLLLGPPGAGKEAVARAVHGQSGRTGAFIQVHCPGLQARDRSAIFGPERSDTASDPSKLDLAAGGMLYLHTIHELAIELQDELWAILREQQEARSRGDTPARDVRIVASTTRDLTGEAERGRFDARLARILTENRLIVPALAERGDDIPLLVDHFVRLHARQLGKTVEGVSQESMRRLVSYPWPGNIRELRTFIERAVLMARDAVLEIDEDSFDKRLGMGSYRLVSQIGSGGMGEVWLAKHRLLTRPAAVKLIRPGVRHGEQYDTLVRRFEREAQVIAGLRSPHTVQLYDFGVHDNGSFYYVMELLEGMDLQRMLRQYGPQPAERVVAFLRQACRSLAEAHAHGLVHRDIKPANLFVAELGGEYDFLKLLDFGMVKDEPRGDVTQLSAEGMVLGTPAYMAPETILGEVEIDGRADLYSLACTAYEVLTGVQVFTASTTARLLLDHVRARPVPPSQVSKWPIPPALEALLLQCLEKDPSSRPGSAVDLEAELGRIDCDPPWTQARARAWWHRHAPELVANGAKHLDSGTVDRGAARQRAIAGAVAAVAKAETGRTHGAVEQGAADRGAADRSAADRGTSKVFVAPLGRLRAAYSRWIERANRRIER